jgi:uncharacterized protein (TIGR02001 family)
MLKKTIVASAVIAAFASGFAHAQQPQTPASPHTFTGNVGIFSQYIFRGLTQTNNDPAIQGGFDYSHSSGFYLGTWASNISWLKENASTTIGGVPLVAGTYGEGGSMEWDFYGGYKWGFAPDWTLDLGTLYYYYPGKTNALAGFAPTPFNDIPKADTWEIYGGLSWKWLSAKVSYSVDDKTFGVKDSSGTYYVDLSANVPLGDFAKEMNGLTLLLHWGYQRYSGTDPRNAFFSRTGLGNSGPGAPYPAIPDNDELFSYQDWKIGLTYALPKDFVVGAYYTDTSSLNNLGYGAVGDCARPGFCGPFPRNIGKGTGTIFIQKTF